jgi:hypothetical protein
MRISLDLDTDEIRSLHKAKSLIEEALAQREGRQVSAPAPKIEEPVHAPPVQSSFTRMEAPRPQMTPRPVMTSPPPRAPAVSTQESYNMLNLLSGKNRK